MTLPIVMLPPDVLSMTAIVKVGSNSKFTILFVLHYKH